MKLGCVYKAGLPLSIVLGSFTRNFCSISLVLDDLGDTLFRCFILLTNVVVLNTLNTGLTDLCPYTTAKQTPFSATTSPPDMASRNHTWAGIGSWLQSSPFLDDKK